MVLVALASVAVVVAAHLHRGGPAAVRSARPQAAHAASPGSTAGSTAGSSGPTGPSSTAGTPTSTAPSAPAWSAPALVDPFGHLSSLSCASPSFCMGLDADLHGSYLFAGGAWSRVAMPGGAYLGAVSCPTAGSCVAVDANAHLWTYADGAWSHASSLRAEPVASNLTSISCATPASCMVGTTGGEVLGLSRGVLVRSWKLAQEPFGGVACPTSAFCVAVSGDEAFTYAGGTWSRGVPLDHPRSQAQRYAHFLDAVACSSPSFCVAVDSSGDAFTDAAGQWSAGVMVAGVGLASVSCPAAGRCMALGSDGEAFHLSGGSWSSATPAASGAGDPTTLSVAVSCPLATWCAATDAGHVATYASP